MAPLPKASQRPAVPWSASLLRFGGHGYDHIFVNVVPLMKDRSYTQAEIDAILIHNPRRLLTIQ